jgi:hypothetical protein
VPAPDRADAERRDGHPSFPKLVRDANLAPGGLFDGDGNDGVLDLWRHTVLQDGLAPRDLLQGKFAAFVVKLL